MTILKSKLSFTNEFLYQPYLLQAGKLLVENLEWASLRKGTGSDNLLGCPHSRQVLIYRATVREQNDGDESSSAYVHQWNLFLIGLL